MLAGIKFVVIRPKLIAKFVHVVNYLVPSAYITII